MNKDVQTEATIWKRFLDGDESVLSDIYNDQYARLYAYGIKFVTDKELVKDCIQDLFVKIFCNRKQLKETKNLNTYLIRALKNKLYDALSAHVEMYDIDDIYFDLSADDAFLSLYSETDEELAQKQKLKSALEQLSSRQREAIYLKFIQNIDYGELGDLLDINYQSAKNLVSRAIIKLREIYFSI